MPFAAFIKDILLSEKWIQTLYPIDFLWECIRLWILILSAGNSNELNNVISFGNDTVSFLHTSPSADWSPQTSLLPLSIETLITISNFTEINVASCWGRHEEGKQNQSLNKCHRQPSVSMGTVTVEVSVLGNKVQCTHRTCPRLHNDPCAEVVWQLPQLKLDTHTLPENAFINRNNSNDSPEGHWRAPIPHQILLLSSFCQR